MEGITDSIYRTVHHKHFTGVTRYFMPFLSPTVHRSLTPREARELPKADSVPFSAVPQLLTKVSEDFLWAAEVCKDLGYDEVNLNLGCPSGTVTAKGKGSGMLRNPAHLRAFLDEIFSAAPLSISIKTRLGYESIDEFPALLEIFNDYPIKELTLHPRVRQAFYKGSVDMEAFRYCLANSKNSVCYNGNLCNLTQIEAFHKEFPQVESLMIGRGLVGDPGMLTPGGTTAGALEAFMDDLLDAYQVAFGSARNAMFRLKENWHLLAYRFEGSEKLIKRLRKTTDLEEYRSITREIFHGLPLTKELDPQW